MKTKIKEIVSAYKLLGEAKVNNLEESEILKILKARKTMRPIAEEFESFLKDCLDKLKPEDWEEIQNKLLQWSELSETEKALLTNKIRSYEQIINNAVADEINKEIDICIDSISEDSVTKLLKNNEWTFCKLDDISILL